MENKIVRFQSSGEIPYPLQVKGESYHRKEIRSLFDHIDPQEGIDATNLTAHLIMEDTNPYDKNAVRVDIQKQAVGYLDKVDALKYRQQLKKLKLSGVIGEVGASIKGGFRLQSGDLADFGILLDLDLDDIRIESKTPMVKHSKRRNLLMILILATIALFAICILIGTIANVVG